MCEWQSSQRIAVHEVYHLGVFSIKCYIILKSNIYEFISQFFVLDAKDCPKNWLGMCKKFGDFGECVGEPLNPLGNGHCKCYKGYYDLFPRGCVGRAQSLFHLSHPLVISAPDLTYKTLSPS